MDLEELPEPEKPNQVERIIIPRKTFNKDNASKYKALFDANIESKNQAFLPLSKIQPPIKINTLHQRINEALLFLIERGLEDFPDSKYKPIDYLNYRSRVSFRMIMHNGQEGILFDWTGRSKKPKRRASSQVVSGDALSNLGNTTSQLTTSWKDRIISFIEDNDQKTISIDTPDEFGGVYLSELDIEWLNKILTSAGMEYELGPQLIRAVKG